MKNFKLIFLIFMFLTSYAVKADQNIGSWNVEISGTVLSSSCNVSADTLNQTVHIGDFSPDKFATVGAVTPAKSFNIILTDCSESINSVNVVFKGTSDQDNSDLLALTNTTGMATGIGVEILDKNQNSKPINKVNEDIPLSPGDNTLSYFLRYRSTKVLVTPGNATAVMYFDLTYQ